MNLKNKKIVLGITGSIAAYKAPLLVRELIKSGAEVRVLMTEAAKAFVTPLVLKNLSGNPVIIDMFGESTQQGGAWHIQLAHWCDLMIVAPCSATTLSKMASALCDNALVSVATALPRYKPFLVAPAMDSDMYLHPATQRNIKQLKQDGAVIIPPDEGLLASGLEGPGRLPDTEILMDYIINALNSSMAEEKPNDNESKKPNERKQDHAGKAIYEAVEKSVFTLNDAVEKDKWTAEFELHKMKHEGSGEADHDKFLKGKKVLITAGPTLEKIDDVRYISNHSSGKMGYAIASQAVRAGANVILISGPVSIPAPEGVNFIHITTAEEMYNAAVKEFVNSDISILAAAVADYTPVNPETGKLKKEIVGDNFTLQLKATKDILSELGKTKKEGQKLVGFALESINEIENGWKKLKAKNCDMIVVNSAGKPRSGFGGEDNTITILSRDGKEESFPPMSKEACAAIILKKINEI